MRERDAKSHRAGRATLAAGGSTGAYRAVEALACGRCEAVIAAGEIFTRGTRRTPVRAMGKTTTEPVCASCRPLRLDNAAGDAD